MSKKKKYRGHYCWCCGCIRPNEKFSGNGHRRHLCKDCKKLGKEEIAFRQHQRDIDRLLDWDGKIRRKTRHVFQSYLNHSDPRVQVYAEKVQAHSEHAYRRFRFFFRFLLFWLFEVLAVDGLIGSAAPCCFLGSTD